MPFKIASENKCLGIHLTNVVEDFYAENHKKIDL